MALLPSQTLKELRAQGDAKGHTGLLQALVACVIDQIVSHTIEQGGGNFFICDRALARPFDGRMLVALRRALSPHNKEQQGEFLPVAEP